MRAQDGFTIIENTSSYFLKEGDVICSKYYPDVDNPYIAIADYDEGKHTVDRLGALHGIKDCVGYAKIKNEKKVEWIKLGRDDVIPNGAIWVTKGCEIPAYTNGQRLEAKYPGIGKTVGWARTHGYLGSPADLYAKQADMVKRGHYQPRRLPMNPIFSKPLPLP